MIRKETRQRVRALQLLYLNESIPDASIDDAFLGLARLTGPHPDILEGARELADGVLANQVELDGHARDAADNWRLERMALIERNILRIAIYELMMARVPPRVAIDEAIWMAQRFAGEKAPSFVNGVLDNVARSLGRL